MDKQRHLVATLCDCAHAGGVVSEQSAHEKTRELEQWSYEGKTGPRNWGKLHAAFAQCSVGQQQSPIDITSFQVGDKLAPVGFYYEKTVVCIQNNGHTLVAQFNNGGFIEVDGERYNLLEFHFHVGGEHRLNGKAYPAEVHLVHQDNQGRLMVVGVWIDQGQTHPHLATLFKQLPRRAQEKGPSLPFHAGDLLPKKQRYFHYQGSLTKPPCTQGVQWYVMVDPVTAGKTQIAKLLQAMSGKTNNRPVQPLNGRTVWHSRH